MKLAKRQVPMLPFILRLQAWQPMKASWLQTWRANRQYWKSELHHA